MLFASDDDVGILSLLLLLALAYVTVQACRRDRGNRAESEDEFLFSGKNQLHSLASNVGAFFSLTYFFGGAIAYGAVFGLWYLLMALVLLGLAALILLKMVSRLWDGAKSDDSSLSSNVLLDQLSSLSECNFLSVVRVYVAVYGLLLVVELAVGRLVLSTLFLSRPALAAMALAVICAVVYAYLAYGGFRAVLNSDLVQMAPAGLFVLWLLALMAKSPHAFWGAVVESSRQVPSSAYGTLLFTIVLGLAWFGAGIDFFSRLNFRVKGRRATLGELKKFVVISLVSTFAVLGVGILYGVYLRSHISAISSPKTYTVEAIGHFLSLGGPFLSAVFVTSIFCMIFTTIDTLFLSLLQLGRYNKKIHFLSRRSLFQLIAFAVGASLFVSFEGVSALAVFAASLMLVPAAGVLKSVTKRFDALVPDLRYLEGALVGCAVVFAFVFDDLKSQFERHFLIPGLVAAAVLLAVAISRVATQGTAK